MLIELIIALLLGCTMGTFTGLTPGIHINLIAALLLTSTFLLSFNSSLLIAFIISMAITHTFTDFIPSIYLGAPDEDTGFATLPGHEFLKMGNAHKALTLTLIGSVIAIASLIIIIPFFIFIIPKIYPFIQKMLAWFLIWISIFLIYHEKPNHTKAFIIFALSGFIGVASLNMPLSQPLLPLLTGFFATSTLLYSIKSRPKIPKQNIEKNSIQKSQLIKPTLATILISPVCSLFPGLGSSQAAVISTQAVKNISKEQFLILLGSINTLVMATSFITLATLSKTRTGAASALAQITTITSANLLLILISILASSILAIPLTLWLSKLFAKNISKFNYNKISIFIFILLVILNAYFTGLLGLAVLTTSTALGLTAMKMNVRKGLLMGSLLIPTIIFYLPF